VIEAVRIPFLYLQNFFISDVWFRS